MADTLFSLKSNFFMRVLALINESNLTTLLRKFHGSSHCLL